MSGSARIHYLVMFRFYDVTFFFPDAALRIFVVILEVCPI